MQQQLKTEVSIYDCIDEIYLKSDFTCEICQQTEFVSHKSKLQQNSHPPYLILVLERFTKEKFKVVKDKKSIDFPLLNFDLGKFKDKKVFVEGDANSPLRKIKRANSGDIQDVVAEE